MNETLTRDCECWEHTASLSFVGKGVTKEAIRHIYCPVCSEGIRKDDVCMTEKKGWLIEYDPNLLRSKPSTLRLIQNRRVAGSFLICAERKEVLANDI